MRLSRIWKILQQGYPEGLKVIHRGRGPKWITPTEIGRILHILQKPNSIIALLFIQIFPRSQRRFANLPSVFPLTKNNTILSSGFLGHRFNNLQWAALLMPFWRYRFNNLQRAALLTSLALYLVNISCLWGIMRLVWTNQKRGNILNE